MHVQPVLMSGQIVVFEITAGVNQGRGIEFATFNGCFHTRAFISVEVACHHGMNARVTD